MGDAVVKTMELARVGELDTAELKAWSALHMDNPALASPFFHPGYQRLVDASREGADSRVEVVLGRDGSGRTVLFWPFEREGRRLAVPAGRFLTDYQGVVCDPSVTVDALPLLRVAGLDRWRFDHVPVDQSTFATWRTSTAPSPTIGLGAGFEAWAGAVRSVVRDTEGQRRRLERRVGPVRFEHRTTDPQVLDRLIAWKSAQYQATGKRDVFAVAWCRRLVSDLIGMQVDGFAGWLSGLWAGDELVAAHLGLRSSGVWHYWLPAYDTKHAKLSPGSILLLEMARRAPELDIEVIDLGKGQEPYKQRFSNGSVTVSSGVVERRNARSAGRSLGRWFRRGVRRVTPGGTP